MHPSREGRVQLPAGNADAEPPPSKGMQAVAGMKPYLAEARSEKPPPRDPPPIFKGNPPGRIRGTRRKSSEEDSSCGGGASGLLLQADSPLGN